MFHSTGPTDGVLDEGVVKEPDEGQDEDEEVEIGSEEEDEEEEEVCSQHLRSDTKVTL